MYQIQKSMPRDDPMSLLASRQRKALALQTPNLRVQLLHQGELLHLAPPLLPLQVRDVLLGRCQILAQRSRLSVGYLSPLPEIEELLFQLRAAALSDLCAA